MINEAGGSLSANMGDLAKGLKTYPIQTLAGASSVVSFVEETNDILPNYSKSWCRVRR